MKKETPRTKAPTRMPESAPAKKQPPVNPWVQAAEHVFSNIKETAKNIDNKKIDAWQEKWLVMPKTRAKYERLNDLPEVAKEEMIAMSNDIVDFVQGQEGGKSEMLKKLKTEGSQMIHKSFDFIKAKIGAKMNELKAKPQEKTATASKAVKKSKK